MKMSDSGILGNGKLSIEFKNFNRGKGLIIERNRGVQKMKDQEWDEKLGKG